MSTQPSGDDRRASGREPDVRASGRKPDVQPVANPNSDQQMSAVDTYGYLCGTALVLIGLVLVRKGLFPWAMFPVGAGLLGLFFRWRIAPVLIIGITGSCLVYAEPGGLTGGSGQRPSAGFVDIQTWILCSALLAYVIGHYRLQSLSSAIFPPDRRTPKRKSTKDQLERPRAGRTVGSGEIGWLVLTLPFVSFAALLLLRMVPGLKPDAVLNNTSFWVTLLLLWVLGIGVFLGHGLVLYLGLRNLELAEARMYMQDLLWMEMRRDLRRLNRWLVWSRLRKDR